MIKSLILGVVALFGFVAISSATDHCRQLQVVEQYYAPQVRIERVEFVEVPKVRIIQQYYEPVQVQKVQVQKVKNVPFRVRPFFQRRPRQFNLNIQRIVN